MGGSNRVLKKKAAFKLHKETIALAIRSVDPPWKRENFLGIRGFAPHLL